MRLIDIPGQAVESVLSIVGIRVGTEEPHYLASELTDRVEIRRYGPRIAAETTVTADDERARTSDSDAWPAISSAPITATKILP